MANRNTQGFGLVPAGTLAGVSVQNQGKYFIDAGHSTTIYNGEALKPASGYVVGGQGSAAPVLGVLNGIFYNAADTLKPTFANFYKATITPANSEDITAFVLDNPLQQYVVGLDAARTQAQFLETYDMNTSAGSDTTGKSSATWTQVLLVTTTNNLDYLDLQKILKMRILLQLIFLLLFVLI